MKDKGREETSPRHKEVLLKLRFLVSVKQQFFPRYLFVYLFIFQIEFRVCLLFFLQYKTPLKL